MGEIAEMMLDGTLCECCGEFIGEGDGFPQYCSEQCAAGRGADFICEPAPSRASGRTHPCGQCGKKFRSPFAAEQHARDAHKSAKATQVADTERTER